MQDWKKIYAERGIVQEKPSKQIVDLLPILKERGVVKILDHGCGTGRHSLYLASEGFHVVGIDYSETALTTARKNSQWLENPRYMYGPMHNLPFLNSNSFDATISSQVIQHGLKPERDGAFNEIYRTLKPKGLLFLRTISQNHLLFGHGKKIEENTFIDIKELPDGECPHHYFSEEELRDCLSSYNIISLTHQQVAPDPTAFWKYGLAEWSVLAEKK